MDGESGIGIAAGFLDITTGLRIGKHIFVASKGDFYSILHDEEAYEQYLDS